MPITFVALAAINEEKWAQNIVNQVSWCSMKQVKQPHFGNRHSKASCPDSKEKSRNLIKCHMAHPIVRVKIKDIHVVDIILSENLDTEPTSKDDVDEDKAHPQRWHTTEDYFVVFLGVTTVWSVDEEHTQNYHADAYSKVHSKLAGILKPDSHVLVFKHVFGFLSVPICKMFLKKM
jgi:hypothetical protein